MADSVVVGHGGEVPADTLLRALEGTRIALEPRATSTSTGRQPHSERVGCLARGCEITSCKRHTSTCTMSRPTSYSYDTVL